LCRFFTVYGPRGRPDMAPYKFIERVYRGEPIQQYGDGNTSRDYTYISDIVDGVIRAIDRPLGYQVFNLGNGRPRLLKDFIALVEKCVGKSAIVEMLPEQPGDVSHTCADISKAQAMLDYCPKVPFEVGIEKTAEWYIAACRDGLILPPGAEPTAGAIRKSSSHIELDSNVQKAPVQMRYRFERFVSEERDSEADTDSSAGKLSSRFMRHSVG
jgi:hypothetical protein